MHLLTSRALIAVLSLGLACLCACDEEMLSQAPDPPDSGVHPDAYQPPSDSPDASIVLDPEAATEPVYLQTDKRLYSYDPIANTAGFVGVLHTVAGSIADMVDIAIDLEGHMYGGTQNGDIFRIDARDASCRYATTSDHGVTGMTFLSDGRLVVAGEGVAIVDLLTGMITEQLVAPGLYQTSGDIIGLPDGKLFWTVQGPRDQGDGLVLIDPSTGAVQDLGIGAIDGLFGLGWAYGSLYGFSPNGIAVTLDPTSGSVLEERMLEGRWFGATTNPVLW